MIRAAGDIAGRKILILSLDAFDVRSLVEDREPIVMDLKPFTGGALKRSVLLHIEAPADYNKRLAEIVALDANEVYLTLDAGGVALLLEARQTITFDLRAYLPDDLDESVILHLEAPENFERRSRDLYDAAKQDNAVIHLLNGAHSGTVH